MLTIRDAQMRALEGEMQRRFEVRMEDYLRSAYADQLQSKTSEEVLHLIRQGITKSEQYGIVIENDVSRYITYMVTHGADFDRTEAWAAEIFQDSRINGTQKMDRIDDYDFRGGRGGLR